MERRNEIQILPFFSLPLFKQKFQLFCVVAEVRPKRKRRKRKKIQLTMKRLVEQMPPLMRAVLLCKLFVSKFWFFQKLLISFIFLASREEKEEAQQNSETPPQTTPTSAKINIQTQATIEQQPEVDEDGYCIQPKDPLWQTNANKKATGRGKTYRVQSAYIWWCGWL